MDKNNKVQFFRKTVKSGGSLTISIPPELCDYVDIKEGDLIGLVGDEAKHGKYIGLWNEDKQKVQKKAAK